MTEKIKHKELLKLLTYDKLTGLFTRLVTISPNAMKSDIAGNIPCKISGYCRISVEGVSYYTHVLAWFYYYGYWPENELDHKDRIRHHNWILNLREVSRQCQMRNTGNINSNTSGIKGVNKDKKGWRAFITIDRKYKGLGRYKNFHNAVCARLAAEQCVDWAGCDSTSSAYLYVKEMLNAGVKEL